MEENPYFTIQTRMAQFSGHPHSSPYFTISLTPNENFEAEISGNAQLTPKLSDEEYNLMELLGWEKPKKGKDEDYGDFPNFLREFPAETDPLDVVEAVLVALLMVYQMRETDIFEVGNEFDADEAENLKWLERLEPEEGFSRRTLFRLPTDKELF